MDLVEEVPRQLRAFDSEKVTYPLPGEIVRLDTGPKVKLFPLHLVDEQGRLKNREETLDEVCQQGVRETVTFIDSWRDTRTQHGFTQF